MTVAVVAWRSVEGECDHSMVVAAIRTATDAIADNMGRLMGSLRSIHDQTPLFDPNESLDPNCFGAASRYR